MSAERPEQKAAASVTPGVRLRKRSQRQALTSRLTHVLDRFSEETSAKALGQNDIGTITRLALPEMWADADFSSLVRIAAVEDGSTR